MVIDRMEMEGDGIFDSFIRKDFSPSGKALLASIGDVPIKRITLSRAPINSLLRKALNVITLGQFEKAIKSMGHDKLFHLSMLCEVGDKRVVIEKNSTVNISTGVSQKKDSEFKDVPLKGHITLNDMLSKTALVMGDAFWTYNAFNNNCQVFIDTILKTNGLLTPSIHDWLFQDIPELEKSLGFSSNIVNAVTDVGAVANNLIGQGFNPMDAVVHAHCMRLEGGSAKSKLMGLMIAKDKDFIKSGKGRQRLRKNKIPPRASKDALLTLELALQKKASLKKKVKG